MVCFGVFLGVCVFNLVFYKKQEHTLKKIAEKVSVELQRLHFNCLSNFLLEIHGSLYVHLHTLNLVPIFSKKKF